MRIAAVALCLLAGTLSLPTLGANAATVTSYVVVFSGTQTSGGFDMNRQAALSLVNTAGGTVVRDMSRQIGVMIVRSSNVAFESTLSASTLVSSISQDFKWRSFEGGSRATLDPSGPGGTEDPLESLQWDMQQIRSPQAHSREDGWARVDVGILDSGIDGSHLDFDADAVAGGPRNVDCARGRDFVLLVGPGLGNPNPCVDNQFHGTHVAGTVGARANGHGIVGVAPNVTLVPVKVCDTAGFCYASSAIAGMTYAGDAKLDVINMSFFVDDDVIAGSTELKCSSDPVQRTFKQAVQRAITYARNRGVTPVAALGNSDLDLANPPGGNQCEVIPAETDGVIGTMALGRNSGKASYSSYGYGPTDVAAPGGNGTTGDCTTTVLSTFPANGYGCIQGTSMASPHTAGVAALIESRFGTIGGDGDVKLAPGTVQRILQSTTVDIGRRGYDKCFGHGRINAQRAVQRTTTDVYDGTAPFCPEYQE